MSVEFASLHVHSHNSILDGFSTVEEYLDRAAKIGLRGIGLTDHGNLFGVFDFLKRTQDADVKGLPGCEFYVAPENPEGAFNKSAIFYGPGGKKAKNDVASNGSYLHITVWAYNKEGLRNLFRLSTMSYDPRRFRSKPRIDFDMLAENSEGLIIATGCPSSEISTRFLLDQDEKAYEYAGRLLDVFGRDRMFVEIMDHEMEISLERDLLPKQLKLAKHMNLGLLATNDSHYANPEDDKHHEEMLAQQSGSRMSDKTYDEGGRRFAFSGNGYYLKSADEMAHTFPERDFPGALSNSVKILEMADDLRLSYDPDLLPHPKLPEGMDEVEYYKQRVHEGFNWRYGNAPTEVKREAVRRNRVESEVILSSGFEGYMLVVADYLTWTRENFSTKNEDDEIIALSLGVGRGCFLPGTELRTKMGYRKIEEVYRDHSRAIALTHDSTFQKIEDAFEYDVNDEEVVEITLSSGQSFSSTLDHKIFKKDEGFVEAGTLSVGDVLLGAKSSKELITMPCDNCGTVSNPEEMEKLLRMGAGKYKSGTFHSERFAKDLYYASSYELKALNIFETDSSVSDIDRCPDRIPYTNNGSEHLYLPDFLVEDYDGSKKVVEIKAKWELGTDRFIAKREAAEKFYAERGVGYEVWTEDELAEKNDWNHNEITVVSTRRFRYTGKVYDIQVSKVHNYTVAGVTVHNSVGGSIQAYQLGISEIDPIRWNLLFERFLSAGRGATYRVTYDDGTFEDKIASSVNTVERDGEQITLYTHQLKIGDEATSVDDLEESSE